MKASSVDNTNFYGRLVLIGKFSEKPSQCIAKTKESIEKLIEPKGFNLYIRQDYSRSEINISPDYIYPFYAQKNRIQENIPITSKSSKYVDAAKKTIDYCDSDLIKKYEKECLAVQRKAEKRELFHLIGLAPLFFIELVAESIVPNGADKVENFINKAIKFATKKG